MAKNTERAKAQHKLTIVVKFDAKCTTKVARKLVAEFAKGDIYYPTATEDHNITQFEVTAIQVQR